MCVCVWWGSVSVCVCGGVCDCVCGGGGGVCECVCVCGGGSVSVCGWGVHFFKLVLH